MVPKPLFDWIVVKPIEEEKSEGGIILPNNVTSKSIKMATVVEMSPEVPHFHEENFETPLGYGVGSKVCFYVQNGIAFETKGEKYLYMKYNAVMAVEE